MFISEDEYLKWLEVISQRYRQCQIKAAVAVNRDLIEFYWSLGRDIAERGAEKYYGSGFYDKISKDLKEKFKDGKGFSSRNIRYMSAAAPALKMCLFLLLELFSLMADISFHICELISYLSGSSALRSLK